MDQFYIHLTSNIANVKGTEDNESNRIASFTTNLSQTVQSDEDLEIALTEVSITNSWRNLHDHSKVILGSPTKWRFRNIQPGRYGQTELKDAVNEAVISLWSSNFSSDTLRVPFVVFDSKSQMFRQVVYEHKTTIPAGQFKEQGEEEKVEEANDAPEAVTAVKQVAETEGSEKPVARAKRQSAAAAATTTNATNTSPEVELRGKRQDEQQSIQQQLAEKFSNASSSKPDIVKPDEFAIFTAGGYFLPSQTLQHETLALYLESGIRALLGLHTSLRIPEGKFVTKEAICSTSANQNQQNSSFCLRAIKDEFINVSEYGDIAGGYNSILLYINLIRPGYVGDRQAQLLKVIHVDSSSQPYDHLYHSYDVLEFKPLLAREFSSIEVALYDDSGQLVPFQFGSVRLTLAFRRHVRSH